MWIKLYIYVLYVEQCHCVDVFYNTVHGRSFYNLGLEWLGDVALGRGYLGLLSSYTNPHSTMLLWFVYMIEVGMEGFQTLRHQHTVFSRSV